MSGSRFSVLSEEPRQQTQNGFGFGGGRSSGGSGSFGCAVCRDSRLLASAAEYSYDERARSSGTVVLLAESQAAVSAAGGPRPGPRRTRAPETALEGRRAVRRRWREAALEAHMLRARA